MPFEVPVGEDVVVVVDVHVEPGAVLDGELDGRVAGEAGMLDGVDAGEDRVADALVAMGVGGDLAGRSMCASSAIAFISS